MRFEPSCIATLNLPHCTISSIFTSTMRLWKSWIWTT